MNSKIVLILAILAVLVLGAITLLVVYSNSGSGVLFSQSNQDSIEKSGSILAAEYGSDIVYSYGNACENMNDYACFQYQELEQMRLEPCPAPVPVCPLCREGLEQVKGDGHMEDLAQVKILC